MRPAVSVTWESMFRASRPQSLFGPTKTWIKLREFCSEGAAALARNDEGYLDEVYEYYIYQVQLMAAMCLDRNYLGISQLEEVMHFDVVFACMMDTQLTLRMRMAFCKLLQSLWVRDYL